MQFHIIKISNHSKTKIKEIQHLLEEIYSSGKVFDSNNKEYEVGLTSISKKEGEFIQNIIESNNITNTIEVGCAYGLSSLFICLGLSKKYSKHHTIIDPFQSSQWNNIGFENLKKTGVNYFELIEDYSELALPKLLKDGKKFDLGFIDGWHTLDHTLIDFFYINKMLSVNGIIIFDDVTYPSINKLMGYISQYPSYEVIGTVEMSYPRRELEKILTFPLKLLSLILPFSVTSRILPGHIAQKNRQFKLNTSMIALKKIKEDERSYDWFKQF
ncbi:MAG: class I SAM-dependent methyltransferase [Flavobacteriaceae bacterium]|nr:class I SAM-dependent methyltransferase [Bacteroidia bacterium]NNL16598.1 class I SAM-dependent methyltransferase [Flavobacteriaceae bacterium]